MIGRKSHTGRETIGLTYASPPSSPCDSQSSVMPLRLYFRTQSNTSSANESFRTKAARGSMSPPMHGITVNPASR